MANPLEVTQLALDIIAIGKGLPRGSIQPGDLTPEELAQEAKDLGAIIILASWSLCGVLSVIELEFQKSDRDVKKMIGQNYNSFPFRYYQNFRKVLEAMVDMDAPLYCSVHHEIYHAAMTLGDLTKEERIFILNNALYNGWTPTFCKNLIYQFGRNKVKAPDLMTAYMDAVRKLTHKREDLPGVFNRLDSPPVRTDVAEENEGEVIDD